MDLGLVLVGAGIDGGGGSWSAVSITFIKSQFAVEMFRLSPAPSLPSGFSFALERSECTIGAIAGIS